MPLSLTATRDMSRGDLCTCHSLSVDIHFGTHLDAPSHFVADGLTVDQLPLPITCGACEVVEFTEPGMPEIPARVMKGLPSERVLFKTTNSKFLSCKEFHPEFVALSQELAASLVKNRVRLVGIDYFSVDPFTSVTRAIHKLLLEAGIVILEGLDLSTVEPGTYQLIALPLNILGAEGSPVRAVLVE
jgi:arylformamidase